MERCELIGGCLCGGVRFAASGPVGGNSACHCGQCRRWSGHVWASVNVPAEGLKITGNPRWFRSSDSAERGFCPDCGSALFWRKIGGDEIALAMGALDAPTGLRLSRHIFVADKGDYYEIADGLPQEAGG